MPTVAAPRVQPDPHWIGALYLGHGDRVEVGTAYGESLNTYGQSPLRTVDYVEVVRASYGLVRVHFQDRAALTCGRYQEFHRP